MQRKQIQYLSVLGRMATMIQIQKVTGKNQKKRICLCVCFGVFRVKNTPLLRMNECIYVIGSCVYTFIRMLMPANGRILTHYTGRMWNVAFEQWALFALFSTHSHTNTCEKLFIVNW